MPARAWLQRGYIAALVRASGRTRRRGAPWRSGCGRGAVLGTLREPLRRAPGRRAGPRSADARAGAAAPRAAPLVLADATADSLCRPRASTRSSTSARVHFVEDWERASTRSAACCGPGGATTSSGSPGAPAAVALPARDGGIRADGRAGPETLLAALGRRGLAVGDRWCVRACARDVPGRRRDRSRRRSRSRDLRAQPRGPSRSVSRASAPLRGRACQGQHRRERIRPSASSSARAAS